MAFGAYRRRGDGIAHSCRSLGSNRSMLSGQPARHVLPGVSIEIGLIVRAAASEQHYGGQ
jgi:hypothetical protein